MLFAALRDMQWRKAAPHHCDRQHRTDFRNDARDDRTVERAALTRA
jgi:hypothetical protein